MFRPKLFWYLKETYKVKQIHAACVKITSTDPDLVPLLRSMIAIDAGTALTRHSALMKTHRDTIRSSLTRLLVTPNSHVGKRRRTLLQKAGYEVYFVDEVIYSRCVVGIRGKHETLFSKPT